MKLRMSEFDDDFSEDFAEGSEVITHKYICVLTMSSFQTGHSVIEEYQTQALYNALLKIQHWDLNTCTETRVKVI